MFDRDPIRQNPLAPQSMRLGCEAWESLVPDALDGTLFGHELATFERHTQECAACAQMLKEARQGVEWLSFLESQPQIPSDLVSKILARTSGTDSSRFLSPAGVAPSPAWYRVAAPITRRVLEPRSLRTAAMAFFSLALTLNLTGIKLSEVRLSDLRPAALRSHLIRHYYSANAQVVKYYKNLRFVYEMEARMRELRQSTEAAPAKPHSYPTSRNGGKAPNSHAGGSVEPHSGSPSGETESATAGEGTHSSHMLAKGTKVRAERNLA